jgi:hypothetical protein
MQRENQECQSLQGSALSREEFQHKRIDRSKSLMLWNDLNYVTILFIHLLEFTNGDSEQILYYSHSFF